MIIFDDLLKVPCKYPKLGRVKENVFKKQVLDVWLRHGRRLQRDRLEHDAPGENMNKILNQQYNNKPKP